MTATISYDEWMKELNLVGLQPGGDGATTRELADACGHTVPWVLGRLRKAIAAGIVETCRKQVAGIDGRITPVAAYRLCKRRNLMAKG